MRSIGPPESLDPVEDPLGGRLLHLVHHAAVREEDDPVRVTRRDRVVRHHHDRLAHLVYCPPHERQHLGARMRVEVPVGSSAKMICGLLANARATATRCCCPPDSSLGR